METYPQATTTGCDTKCDPADDYHAAACRNPERAAAIDAFLTNPTMKVGAADPTVKVSLDQFWTGDELEWLRANLDMTAERS